MQSIDNAEDSNWLSQTTIGYSGDLHDQTAESGNPQGWLHMERRCGVNGGENGRSCLGGSFSCMRTWLAVVEWQVADRM